MSNVQGVGDQISTVNIFTFDLKLEFNAIHSDARRMFAVTEASNIWSQISNLPLKTGPTDVNIWTVWESGSWVTF